MKQKKRLALFAAAGLLIIGGTAAVASAQTRTGAAQPLAVHTTQQASLQAANEEKAALSESAVEKENGAGASDATEAGEGNLPNGGHSDPQGSAADHQHEGVE